MSNDIEIKYQTSSLANIISYYVKGFQEEILNYDYWIDTNKQEVVFSFTLERRPPMNLDKINELVAENVMGWKTHSRSEILWYTGHTSRLKELFKPSSDIAAAMEVVKKLKESFYLVSINIYQDDCSVIVWDDDIKVAASQEGKELPECIALAALKAKGIEVGVGE